MRGRILAEARMAFRLLIVACSAAAALAVGLSVHASPHALRALNATAQHAF